MDGVSVAGDDEDAVALVRSLDGEGGEDIVGLVVLDRDRRDVHGLEGVLQERNLTDELGRRLSASALVIRVLAGAERVPRDVEGDRDVGGLLVLQQIEEHGDEAVDRVGVLTLAVLETVDGQRVERTECERVAVDDEEGRLFVVRHSPQPTSRLRHRVGAEARRCA